MPFNITSKKPSTETFQILSEDEIDFERCCGEPLRPQHSMIEFDDSEPSGLQKKCIEFWDFITHQPELEGMIIKPVQNVVLDSVVIEPANSKLQGKFNNSGFKKNTKHTIKYLDNKGAIRTPEIQPSSELHNNLIV